MSSCLPAKNFWLEHEWLKSSNESILEYHKNSIPQWIAESCHRYQVITYRELRLGGLGIEKQNPQVCPTHGEADSADENAVAKALPLLQNKCAEYPLE
ncbi:hypothetical protein GLOIN_2v1886406 [Rhizophagus irregularis DAOM 181602=DAOM 197198]|nr:hypothetical protein GLOIN_2v1886406 [Rhizophagus irregularis DAOM 181602=DAOM 197198]